MGGGPDPKPEHLLVLIPFAEPTAIFERIKKNHPHIRISYYNMLIKDTPWESDDEKIPKGKQTSVAVASRSSNDR